MANKFRSQKDNRKTPPIIHFYCSVISMSDIDFHIYLMKDVFISNLCIMEDVFIDNFALLVSEEFSSFKITQK